MKMDDALRIIAGGPMVPGFMVAFSHVEGRFERTDHFPDKHAGEPLIPSEDEAWELAIAFAEKTIGKCCNICVVDARFEPVPGYEARRIVNKG